MAQDKTSGPTSVESQSVGPGQAIRKEVTSDWARAVPICRRRWAVGGRPLCTRDPLDDIAMRFREVIGVRRTQVIDTPRKCYAGIAARLPYLND